MGTDRDLTPQKHTRPTQPAKYAADFSADFSAEFGADYSADYGGEPPAGGSPQKTAEPNQDYRPS